MADDKKQIKFEDGLIQTRKYTSGGDLPWERYSPASFKGVLGHFIEGIGDLNDKNQRAVTTHHENLNKVSLMFKENDAQADIQIHLADVENQPTWADTLAGLNIALTDIGGWLSEGSGLGSGVSTGANSNLEGSERSWSFTTLTDGDVGVTPTDAKALAFQSVGAANTIDGKTLPNPFSFGVSVDFPDTLAENAYVVGAGGTLTIVYVLS
jgi:hypothetical protein